LVLRVGGTTPTDGVGVDLGAGGSTASGSTVITGLAQEQGYELRLYELQGGDAARWSQPTKLVAKTAPKPVTNLSWETTNQHPTSGYVTWQYGGMNCNFGNCGGALVVMKPGSVPPVDPSDGTAVPGPGGESTALSLAYLDDLTLHQTYSVSVFNTYGDDGVHPIYYSVGRSVIFTITAMAFSDTTSSVPTSQHQGVDVTFTTKFSGALGVPTGTVDFVTDGPRTLCNDVPIVGGVAKCRTNTSKMVPGWDVVAPSYSGDATYELDGGTSLDFFVGADVSASISTATVQRGHQATISGKVAPIFAGKNVELQQLRSGSWHTVKTGTLNKRSRFAFAVKPTSKGRLVYRAHFGKQTHYLAGTSKQLHLKVV
jgi:hypothetical protein